MTRGGIRVAQGVLKVDEAFVHRCQTGIIAGVSGRVADDPSLAADLPLSLNSETLLR